MGLRSILKQGGVALAGFPIGIRTIRVYEHPKSNKWVMGFVGAVGFSIPGDMFTKKHARLTDALMRLAEYSNVDGNAQRFRLSISGELYLGQEAKGETVFKQRVVGLSFKVFDDGAGKMLAKLLEIEYGEKASPMHLVVERSIPDSGTFFLRDKDRLMRVEASQTKTTLGEDFEKVLGKNGLENLRNKLGSKKAALALVYMGEDNAVHSVWSQELEFSFKHHPARRTA